MKKKLWMIAIIFILMLTGTTTAYAKESEDIEEDYDYDSYRDYYDNIVWGDTIDDNKYPVNEKEYYVLINNKEERKRGLEEYMSRLFTDESKLRLLLRPTTNIDSHNPEIIKLANEITASLSNDYDKAKAIHQWVCENIYYDFTCTNIDDFGFALDSNGEQIYDNDGDEIDAQMASYILKTRVGVCEGYTNLTVALLRASGIPATITIGLANGNTGWAGHAWTTAYIKDMNQWIIIDTTFDSGNSYIEAQYRNNSMRTDYFDASIDTFYTNHAVWEPLYYNEDGPNIDEAEEYGEKIDVTRTDLYFYYDDAYISLYGKKQYDRGVNIWDGEFFHDPRFESWVSSNPEVATVSDYGQVTAHQYGTTTISLAYVDDGNEASFVLHVEPVKLHIWCAPNLVVGESYSIILDEDSEEYVKLDPKFYKWESSNSKVATVDKDGTVIAVSKGVAKIKVTSLDGKASTSTTVEVHNKLKNVQLVNKSVIIQENKTFDLYPKFIPLDGYRIGYWFVWSISNPKVIEIEEMDDYCIIKGLKSGSATLTMNIIDVNDNIVFSDTCKVTVKEANKYKVTFKTNGGTAVKSTMVKENSTIKNVTTKRTHYRFTGWYTDNFCVYRWDLNNDKITENTTLYAGWQPINPCYITYYTEMNNGYNPLEFYGSDTVAKGTKLKAPKSPTKKGYTFIGWYDKDTNKKWNFSGKKVTNNIVLVAKFKKK